MRASQTSTGLPWEAGGAVAGRAKATESGVSPGRWVVMLPAAVVGLVIGTFPFSLPLLYVIALLFME